MTHREEAVDDVAAVTAPAAWDGGTWRGRLEQLVEVELVGADDHPSAGEGRGHGRSVAPRRRLSLPVPPPPADATDGRSAALASYLTLLAASKRLRRLRLSGVALDRPASEALRCLLERSPSLAELSLEHCRCSRSGEEEDEAEDGTREAGGGRQNQDEEDGGDRGAATAAPHHQTLRRINVVADPTTGSRVLLGAVVEALRRRPRAALETLQIQQPRHPTTSRGDRNPVGASSSSSPPTTWADGLAGAPVKGVRYRGGWQLRPLLRVLRGHPLLRTLHLQSCPATEADIALLSACLSDPKCPLQELAIHEVALGDDGFEALLRAVHRNKSLLVLDACDVHADGRAAARPLRDALRRHPRLRVLRLGDLRFGNDDNREGPRGPTRLLADGVRSSAKLEELDLFYCRGLRWEGLAPALGRLRVVRLPLSCFGMGANRLSRVLRSVLPTEPEPTTRDGDDGTDPAATGVGSSPPPPPSMATPSSVTTGLVELDLSNNRLGDGEAAAVGAYVRRSRTLRSLALDRNGIRDAGAARLFEAAAHHPTLQELGMSGNRLGSPALEALAEALPAINLRRLSVGCVVATAPETPEPERDPLASVVPAVLEGLRRNKTLLALELEDRRGALRLAAVEFYLCRNRIRPLLRDHPRAAQTLWPSVVLHSLSNNQASIVYYVLREKLPTWVSLEALG